MAHVETKPEAIHHWTDPIVAEVRAARDAIAARHAYDIDRISAAFIERRAASGRKVVGVATPGDPPTSPQPPQPPKAS